MPRSQSLTSQSQRANSMEPSGATDRASRDGRRSAAELLPPRPGSGLRRPSGCLASSEVQRPGLPPRPCATAGLSTPPRRPSSGGNIVASAGRHMTGSRVPGAPYGRQSPLNRAPSCPPSWKGRPDEDDVRGRDSQGAPQIVCKVGNAGVLARLARLPVHEVQRMLDLLEAAKREADGALSVGEFERWLSRIFDVDCGALNDDMVKDAKATSLTTEGRVHLNRFMAWYVQNMFTHVASLTAENKSSDSEKLVSHIAKMHNATATTIHDVKAKFDRFDKDGNGELDFEEFTHMLDALFRASTGDIGHARVMRFWQEIDIDGNGVVDFSEFCTWYLKYFADGASKCGLVDAFYESFSPVIQRRKSLAALGGC